MTTYDINKLKLPNNDICNLHDATGAGRMVDGKTITYYDKHTSQRKTATAGTNAEQFNYYELTEPSSSSEPTINAPIGAYSHAEGKGTVALGSRAHAEGNKTYAKGNHSHAEGNDTTAYTSGSHAEGSGSVAGTSTGSTGESAHAEGSHCTASGDQSHAEGYYTTASGGGSHAEGRTTTASGVGSHTSGILTNTNGCRYQTAIGKANVLDTPDPNNGYLGNYAFLIGNGTFTSSGGTDTVVTRSNALAVDWTGKIYTNNATTGFSSSMVDYLSDTGSKNLCDIDGGENTTGSGNYIIPHTQYSATYNWMEWLHTIIAAGTYRVSFTASNYTSGTKFVFKYYYGPSITEYEFISNNGNSGEALVNNFSRDVTFTHNIHGLQLYVSGNAKITDLMIKAPETTNDNFKLYGMANGTLSADLLDNFIYTADTGCKNLFNINSAPPTIYSSPSGTTMSYVINDDGSITVNGTVPANTTVGIDFKRPVIPGKLFANGCPAGGNSDNGFRLDMIANNTVIESDFGCGTARFRLDNLSVSTYILRLRFNAGSSSKTFSNVTFYPMIRRSGVRNIDYKPYVGTNTELDQRIKYNAATGAANLVATICPTRTHNGVTYTRNANGTITLTGAKSASSRYYLTAPFPGSASTDTRTYANAIPISQGTYVISAPDTTSTGVLYSITVYPSSSGTATSHTIYGTSSLSDRTFTISNDTSRFHFTIGVDGTYTAPLTLKPMITPSFIYETDNSFKPYGPSNNSLFGMITPTAYTTPTPATGITIENGGYVRFGNFCIVNIRIRPSANVAVDTNILYGMPIPISGYTTGTNTVAAVTAIAPNDSTDILKRPMLTLTNGRTSGALEGVIQNKTALTSGVMVLITSMYLCE